MTTSMRPAGNAWPLRAILAGLLLPLLVAGTGAASDGKESCPARPLRVAVDVGHTPGRYGATSARGAREFDFNKRFAEEFIESTKANSRIDAALISPNSFVLSLRRRVDLANASDADVFLSIHHDSAQTRLLSPWRYRGQDLLRSDTIAGFSLFVSRDNPHYRDARRIAAEIGRSWRKAEHTPSLHHAAPIEGENRELLDPANGIYEAPFAVIKHTTLPAILIEVGVLINPAEEARLNASAFRHRLQERLVGALLRSACKSKARK